MKIPVSLAYVHPGTVHSSFMDSVLQVFNNFDLDARIAVRSGALIARARNDAVAAFLRSESEYLWFVDTDMVFRPDFVLRLMQAERPIISALYYGQEPTGVRFPVAHNVVDGKVVRARPKGKIAKVAAVGMGCTLIKREVLEALDSAEAFPWFQETVFNDQPVGEDVTFCLRAEAKGFDSYIHTALHAGHIKSVTI
jgi:GT2 family glycosyltransferase